MMRVLTQTKAVIQEDGTLFLKGLSVFRGQEVEVFLYTYDVEEESGENPTILRDEPLIDFDPFEPVAPNDWEAQQ